MIDVPEMEQFNWLITFYIRLNIDRIRNYLIISEIICALSEVFKYYK